MKKQTIKIDNKQFVLLPKHDFDAMVEQLEDLEDIKAIKYYEANPEELLPAEMVYRLAEGKNPIMIYREYRNLTQQALADAVGVSKAYISQLETGKRNGSKKMLEKIAKALNVSINALY